MQDVATDMDVLAVASSELTRLLRFMRVTFLKKLARKIRKEETTAHRAGEYPMISSIMRTAIGPMYCRPIGIVLTNFGSSSFRNALIPVLDASK